MVPIDDDSNCTNFVQLQRTDATHVIRFKATSSIHFSVHLPNGDLVLFDQTGTNPVENYTPFPANPLLQINAYFEVHKDKNFFLFY